MLGLEAKPQPSLTSGSVRQKFVTGCIQITGAWQGAVTVECSGGLARNVAAIMFGMDACDVCQDHINDALGEITNIISGNIKALLPEPSHLSMPAVTEGTDYFFTICGSKPVSEASFSCDGRPFKITVLEKDR
jgi:chemotaxis protein CheX